MTNYKRILLLQSNLEESQLLSSYFTQHGAQVWQTADLNKANTLLEQDKPDLVFLDLHLEGKGWLDLLSHILQQKNPARVIITNRHPDYRKELFAKERGAVVFLREPFTPDWIERALQKLEQDLTALPEQPAGAPALPAVRMPMKLKITLPYVFLALLFAVASATLISRYFLETVQSRFTAQVIDAGKLVSDWMVQEESRRLETLRLVANTRGVAQGVQERNADALRELIIPIAINYQEEAIHILDKNGISLLSLAHRADMAAEDYEFTSGDASFGGLEFVQHVLKGETDAEGNKFAGLAPGLEGEGFFIAGPILDDQGSLVGAVLIGKQLDTLVQEIRQDTLAHVTLYDLEGNLVTSTFLVPSEIAAIPAGLVNSVLQRQDEASTVREQQIASAKYSEIVGPWEVRGGSDLGLVGAAMAQNYLFRPAMLARVEVFLLVAATVLGVIVLGVFLANQITQPLSQVVRASIEVARGNLEIKVPSRGNDEVSVLAHAFNSMVSGLQEGFIYRDLLGRTVSPEVRETMRHSFASGDLRLEGQNTTATVLISDIRGFTPLSEKEEPTTIMTWLNEYFGELVPVITRFGGVVDKFEGDAMLAFFGILPSPLSAQESAWQACQAAAELLAALDQLNLRRSQRGDPLLVTGISINTGALTAGSLGATDRLNYTIIGDTVNATQRMGKITRQFGESGVVVSEYTLDALGEHKEKFHIEPLGQHALEGKSKHLSLFRLYAAGQLAERSDQACETLN